MTTAELDETSELAGLWKDSYQGEVLGEELFRAMAERERVPERRRQLEVLTVLERTTKELAEPVFARNGLDRGDSEATRAEAGKLAEAVAGMSWEQFLGSIPGATETFVAKYRRLAELAPDEDMRAVAEAYVAHEEAFVSFARRALGEEAGDPLERILELPHVAAAMEAETRR